ncbi:hypothetical protein DSO57_1011789 [Entomophthora muscae]|uniref:Uncharacterized protein n=1 Tax=Entomophthora muscae TaxID=34485 RepID=A0ACC2TH34_9FUNG|nr:hypothetical protein DSO57_1011789 [Entomophthora muscae]
MALHLTLRPNHPMEPSTPAEITSTQLIGVLYIIFMGFLDSMVPNPRPWSLLGQSLSYIINLAPILWQALPTGPADPVSSHLVLLPMPGFLTLVPVPSFSLSKFQLC